MPMRVCVCLLLTASSPHARRESERPEARPDRLVVLFAGAAAVNSHWKSVGVVWVGCVGAGC